jgi:hypothetical protein
MSKPGCINKEKCAHFYHELKIDDKFIKGEFCIRFENWPKESIDEICKQIEYCTSFMNRDNCPDNYTAVILRGREYLPGILDLNNIFG